MQAGAELGQQGQGQRGVVLQLAQVGLVGETEQLAGHHGLGGGHVVRGVHEHHRLGEGVAFVGHFENLLLAFRGQPVDLHAAGNQVVEGVRRLALAEHVGALVEVDQVAAGEQFLELDGRKRFEQVVALQQLLVDALEFHAGKARDDEGTGHCSGPGADHLDARQAPGGWVLPSVRRAELLQRVSQGLQTAVVLAAFSPSRRCVICKPSGHCAGSAKDNTETQGIHHGWWRSTDVRIEVCKTPPKRRGFLLPAKNRVAQTTPSSSERSSSALACWRCASR